MASSSHPHPEHDRGRFPLAWEDDDTPGVSVHPLTQADMEAILAHIDGDPHPDRPVQPTSAPTHSRRLAPARRRRRALGTPGASAQAEYRRRRQVEHAAWAHTRPLRLATVVLAGLGGWLAGTLPGLPLYARLVVSVVTMGAAWWGVHHDLRVPGSKANIDHVVVGPPGIFVVDAKHYSGRLRLSHDGQLWHGRYLLAPALSTTRWEADKLQAVIGAPDVAVTPIVAVWGAAVPWGQVTATGVTVVAARRLAGLLRSLPPSLTPERAREVAAQINRRLDARTGR
jgi:hypothetical protein